MRRGQRQTHEARDALRGLSRPVVQDEQLLGNERGLRVCPSFVVRELDFAGAAEHFHDGAYLSATQPV